MSVSVFIGENSAEQFAPWQAKKPALPLHRVSGRHSCSWASAIRRLLPDGLDHGAKQTRHQLALPPATMRADTLIQLRSQPHLKKHIGRINQFRALLKENRESRQPSHRGLTIRWRRTHAGANATRSSRQMCPSDATDAKDDWQSSSWRCQFPPDRVRQPSIRAPV